MPYVGRDLQRGNYLKLDDIGSSFNGSTTTFNLTSGGNAFFPGSAFSILVSLGGVVQEPESAYQIDRSQIIFATAPTSSSDFFCIALGVALGVGVPGHNTVGNNQLAKPISYGDYFRWDSANNRVGINTLLPSTALDVVGDATFSGNVAIGGTLTYEDVANIDAVGIITARAGIEDKTLTAGRVVYVGANGRLVDNSNLTFNPTTLNVPGLNVTGVSTTTQGIQIPNDTYKFRSGTELEMQVWHDGTNSLVKDTRDSGKVRIQADNFDIIDKDASTTVFSAAPGGINSPKIHTFGANINLNDSIIHDGDPDTKIRFPTANTFTVETAGSERLRIRNDGYIGINTTSPTKLVTIKADAPFVRLEAMDGSDKRLDFEVTNVGIATISATQSSQQLSFRTTSGEAIRIQSDGDVGIGTDSPEANLTIHTTTPGENVFNIHADFSTNKNRTFNLFAPATDSGDDPYIFQTPNSMQFKVDAHQGIKIHTNGLVGIGTIVPTDILDVYSDTDPTIRSRSGSSSVGANVEICGGSSNDSQLILSSGTTSKYQFYRDGSQSDDLRIYDSTNSLDIMRYRHGSYLHFGLNGKERFRINSNGSLNIGIGTESTAAANLVEMYVGSDDGTYATIRGKYNRGNEYNRSEVRFGVENNANGRGFLALATGTNSATERLRIGSNGGTMIQNAGTLITSTNETLYIQGEGHNGHGTTNTRSVVSITGAISSNSNSAGIWIGARTNTNTAVIGTRTSTGNLAFETYSGGWGERMRLTYNGSLNIGGDFSQSTYKLFVDGSFAATTKSFVIDHPTKENHKLRYACLEGPENSVYVRGKTSDSVIELPDYWTGLVYEDSITVNVTPIGNHKVWVESINNNSVTIGSDGSEYFYTVFAERKDVDKLEVEVAD